MASLTGNPLRLIEGLLRSPTDKDETIFSISSFDLQLSLREDAEFGSSALTSDLRFAAGIRLNTVRSAAPIVIKNTSKYSLYFAIEPLSLVAASIVCEPARFRLAPKAMVEIVGKAVLNSIEVTLNEVVLVTMFIGAEHRVADRTSANTKLFFLKAQVVQPHRLSTIALAPLTAAAKTTSS